MRLMRRHEDLSDEEATRIRQQTATICAWLVLIAAAWVVTYDLDRLIAALTSPKAWISGLIGYAFSLLFRR